MHLQVYGEKEKGWNTRAHALTCLTSPRLALQGRVRGRTTCAGIVRWNPGQSLADPRLPFAVYFNYESMSNMFS
jgi:hypothetical protein